MFRREWRSQVLVVGLLTVAVAASVFTATAAASAVPRRAAEFGTADHRIEVTVGDQAEVGPYLDDARRWFGDLDVIGRHSSRVPGSTTTVELRDEALDGTYTHPMLDVTSGRAPTGKGEVALTDGVAATFDVRIGDTFTLDGRPRHVVGLVRNPNDFDDEFTLVPPGSLTAPDRLWILVRASDDRVRQFRSPHEPGPTATQVRGATEKTAAALGVLVVASVAMLLVGLVAGAAFVAVADRRRRQLGMLGAIGATTQLLRRAVLANGIIVGACAAVAGTVIATLTWFLVAPALEGPTAHEVSRLAIPPWLVPAAALLAIASAAIAAWLPARAVARTSVTEAIAARPPRPTPLRRSAILAVVLLVAGIAGITFGMNPEDDEVAVYLFLPGLIATVAATLLLAAPCLRLLARWSGRWPVPGRLASRDLSRYGARSAAAVGAISLGLAIAVSIIVIAAAAAPAPGEGNLPADQLVIWSSDQGDGALQTAELSADDLARAQRVVGQAQRDLDATVVPLDVVVDPHSRSSGSGRVLRDIVKLGRQVGPHTIRDAGTVFVASPALLDHLGIDTSGTGSPYLLTTQRSPAYLVGNVPTDFGREPLPASRVRTVSVPGWTSTPRTLMTPAGLSATGMASLRAGWLIDARATPSAAQVARIRKLASQSGLVVEARDPQSGLEDLRTGASVAGIVLALCILAMTIGLLRSEAAHDVRTLTAVGGTSFTRRTLTASTAAIVSIVALVLGTAAAYAAIIAGYWPHVGDLADVPVANLATIAVGFPLVATAVSWLVGGRAPDHLARGPE